MTETPERMKHYKEGLALFGQGKHAEAIEAYGRALELDPEWTDALLGLATAQMHGGRLDEAIATTERIARIDPEDAFAYTTQSMCYQRKGLIDEAEKAQARARLISWKQELKKNPNAPPPGPAGSMDVVQ